MSVLAADTRRHDTGGGFDPFHALYAGAIGAAVNSLAIHVTDWGGIRGGAGGLSRLVLASSRAMGAPLPAKFGWLGQEAFHMTVGLGAAFAYALVGHRLLRGPGALRGFLFVQPMWLAQALIVLPWTGAGVFGWKLGLTTPLWSFALNAVFGVVLGALYAPRNAARSA